MIDFCRIAVWSLASAAPSQDVRHNSAGRGRVQRIARTAFTVGAVALFASCGNCGVDPALETNELAAIEVTPAEVSLDRGDSVSISAAGLDAAGLPFEIADRVTFRSVDETVASVSDDGVVTALAPGRTEVLASVGLIRGVVDVLVNDTAPPAGLSYGPRVLGYAGVALAPVSPTSTGGFIAGYAVDPALPEGLTLDATTGVLAGTPTRAAQPTEYTVTASNEIGSTEAALTVEIRCDPARGMPARVDTPDSAGVDDNGDGIDGMACGPVFVAKAGNDADDGTIDAPLATLAAAVARAASTTPARDVYVFAGTYGQSGALALHGGVSIYGGFDPVSRARAATFITRIDGGTVAVSANDIDIDTELSMLEIQSADAELAGASSVGIQVDGGDGTLLLTDVTVRAGRGAAGTAGADGVDGAPGLDGGYGQPGCEYDTWVSCDECAMPPVGDAPVSPFVRGTGGDGGVPGNGAADGSDGAPGEGGAFGGSAGRRSGDFTGGPGEPGAPGSDGSNGSGGGAAQAGTKGQDGTAGEGGGGGGGGAGGDDGLCDDFGGAGGAGGSGGGRGTGGSPGQPGGTSVALLVAAGAHVDVRGGQLVAGDGGRGGNGGRGGVGLRGGYGRDGGTGTDGSGSGGPGGDGGEGGSGGHGGGAGGGGSFCVLADDASTVTHTQTALVVGSAGQPGTGPGNPGAPGQAIADAVGVMPE